VGFFMPTGMGTPLATSRCSWFSTERAHHRHIGEKVDEVLEVGRVEHLVGG
jgi:hypothetical protein